jgi:uncharacterized protein (DUF427 family)
MPIDRSDRILATDTLELVPIPQRIRALFQGRFVADSRHAAVLLELGHLPVFYLPRSDVDHRTLQASDTSTHCARKGDARYWHLHVDDRTIEDAAWAYPEPIEGVEPLAGYLAFRFDALDAWYEEDEPLEPHPRDPFHRIDTLRSSRHVHVELGGETVVDSRRPVMLTETGTPPRYYVPVTDTALTQLRDSDKRTSCPYKGQARFFHVEAEGLLRENVAWSFEFPRPAATGIAHLLAFDPVHCDLFTVDGEPITT